MSANDDGVYIYSEHPDEPESPEWKAAQEKVTPAMVGARIRELYPNGVAKGFADDAELAEYCMRHYVSVWLDAHEPLVREVMEP